MIVALGELSLDVPQLVDLDLNPVMCRPSDVVPVDAKVGLRNEASLPEGIPRQLRNPG